MQNKPKNYKKNLQKKKAAAKKAKIKKVPDSVRAKAIEKQALKSINQKELDRFK